MVNTMKKRSKRIEKAMRIVWDSLQSHLPYTYKDSADKDATKDFHKKCVREYATVLKLLSELY